MKLTSVKQLEELRNKIISERKKNKICITICSGTGCRANNSEEVVKKFISEIKRLDIPAEVKRTGCHGFCENGPIVVIYPKGICYFKVKKEDVKHIVKETIINGRIIERLLYKDKSTGKSLITEKEIPFYNKQNRILLENNPLIDSRKIEDYIALNGYSALSKALFTMTPLEVLEEIKKSNLRGRGGGGFPAGIKWETTRNAPGEPKYVIANADEGDPGAYMDRSLLEGNPHLILEGLTIGAYAIGANEGFIYVRQEYPLALENTEIAINQAKEYGLIGNNILGSNFNFDVKIKMGAGAFVSGESSALMTAIEGKVGEPRPKYIRTSIKGLWGKPTNLNNVETWANVPIIINKGSDWFRSIGTEKSKGTKIFSLVGKVNNTGLVEVPMGTTLREIIYDIGGGIKEGKKFKAVQTGGPSGGVIPERFLDLPVDFDELTKVGSMMGSGGMIVMDENTCLVDVAKYFINFLCEESCGKCVPCREGLRNMKIILEKITSGKAVEEDIQTLEDLSEVMAEASLCALGKTAPNPVITALRYFKDEFDEHIKEKKCSALVCKALISYYIDPDKCQGCGTCAKNCPVNAIHGDKGKVHVIDQSKCIKCGTCFEVCPDKFKAIIKIAGLNVDNLKAKKKGE